MHYHLLPMGFNKHPIPPYTVSTYQELFHCMNTAFLVEAVSQTCIGGHFDPAHCCLVILCTPRPYLPPFPILHPAPSSSPAPSPQPHTCHNHFFCCPSFPPTPYFTATLSSFPPLLHLSLSLRAQRRLVTRLLLSLSWNLPLHALLPPLPSPSFPYTCFLIRNYCQPIVSFLSPAVRPRTFFWATSWQVTRVVKPDELGRPDESLREQMRKLELSPQEGEDTLTHSSHTHKTLSLLYIMHEVHCVIRLHSVNSMYTDPHRRVWALHHTCLSGCALLLGVE